MLNTKTAKRHAAYNVTRNHTETENAKQFYEFRFRYIPP